MSNRIRLENIVALEFFPNLSDDENDTEYTPNPYYSFNPKGQNKDQRIENAVSMIEEALHDLAGKEDDYIVSVGCIYYINDGTMWYPMTIAKFKRILGNEH